MEINSEAIQGTFLAPGAFRKMIPLGIKWEWFYALFIDSERKIFYRDTEVECESRKGY